MRIFVFFILLLSVSINAQESEEDRERKRILEQYGNNEQYENSIKRENNFEESNQGSLNLNQDLNQNISDQEKLIESLEESRDADIEEINSHKKQLEGLTQKLLQKRGMSEDGELNQSVFTNMMDDKMKAGLAQMIKSNPFSNTSKQEIKRSFIIRTEGTFLESFFKKYPKSLDVITDVFHDKEAIPSFLSIVNQPKKMKFFSGVVITVFVCVFLLNLMNSKSNFFKRLLLKFSLMIGGAVVNFLAFYFIFKEEVRPIVEIVSRSI